ncbi:MAG: NAD(P)-dependent glycerol-3-phosphate dehydrogenase [Actinobacteria bacterium]|nr:NAD(P)-dependent glycerol-3-phosphate dehydrogenase [Actinomycetota bacterium]
MGSGSWGTVFSKVSVDAGNEVVLWSRSAEIAKSINENQSNPFYVSDIELPKKLNATTDPSIALQDADVVVIGLPAQVYRENLSEWKSLIPKGAVMVSLAKGIEFESNLRMTEVIAEATGIASGQLAVLSGPNLAHEIGEQQPSATTVACIDEENAQLVQEACANPYFRPYFTKDVIGVEIAGSMKNVIALANGIAVGLGLGENSQASLITRGLHEMAQLGVALGADQRTFMGLAGAGDLLATSQSPLSRNRSFGVALASGKTVESVIAETRETCEAVKSCLPLLRLGQAAGVSLPITAGVVGVVHKNLDPQELIRRFMSRAIKAEYEDEG